MNLAMDGRCSCPGPLGRNTPHKGLEIRVESSPIAGVTSSCPFQSVDAVRPIGRKPAAQGALRNTALGSYAGQRNILLQVRLKEMETRDGL